MANPLPKTTTKPDCTAYLFNGCAHPQLCEGVGRCMGTPRKSETAAPVGSKTVTVLGSHWRDDHLWSGFDFARAELRSHNLLGVDDYHLGVPWMHPDDIANYGRDPDMEGIYRLRLKRGWKSFVQVNGEWLASKEPRQDKPPFGTPPSGQVSAIIEVKL